MGRLRTRCALLPLVVLPACRTWRPAEPAVPAGAEPGDVARAVAVASGPDARPVRLTTRRGAAVVLLTPRVERDSVVGTDARARARRAVAVADVGRVEAWRVDAGTSLAGVAAGLLVTAAAVYAALIVLVSRGT